MFLQLLVDDEEDDVPGPHAHEGGDEAAVEALDALVLEGGQAAVDGRTVDLFTSDLGSILSTVTVTVPNARL